MLGVDGLDPVLVGRGIDEGTLPNLARLARQGHFTPLATTNPAQSPVSWATAITGLDPGKTRIFGFLRRAAGTYTPESVLYQTVQKPHPLRKRGRRIFVGIATGLAIFLLVFFFARIAVRLSARRTLFLALVSGLAVGAAFPQFQFSRLPGHRIIPVNPRAGTTLWTLSERSGRPASVLFGPLCYPATESISGGLLCGLGVPDLRGTPGLWTIYTSESFRTSETATGGQIVGVPIRNGVGRSFVAGPNDPSVVAREVVLRRRLEKTKPGPDRIPLHQKLGVLESQRLLRVPLQLIPDPEQKSLRLEIGTESETLSPGDWSPWIRVQFDPQHHATWTGQVRFRLISVDPLRLYMTPVHIDPESPPTDISLSSPRGFSAALSRRTGRFPTLGWAVATGALKDETIDEELFLESAWNTFEARRRVILDALEHFQGSLHTSFVYAPDRISHLMWRLIDPESPRYDAQLANRFGGAIQESYRRVDSLVGEILDRFVDESTLLLITSDHGFAPFRYGVHLNAWLREEGFLSLLPEFRNAPADLSHVDWSRTRAYSMGLGKIYLNRRGREPRGIVAPEEVDALEDEIIQRLLAFRDDRLGPVVSRVDRREKLFHGPHVEEAADLFVGFLRGFRVSWETTLGGIPETIVEPNRLAWSGGHASVDPALVPGVFLSNHPVADPQNLALVDLVPTILAALGVTLPPNLDGVAHPFIRTSAQSGKRTR